MIIQPVDLDNFSEQFGTNFFFSNLFQFMVALKLEQLKSSFSTIVHIPGKGHLLS